MPPKDMPKEVSIMGGCPVLGVSSHLLNLAELEAEGKTKKARLRAQQRGRVAKGKKGRFRAALRYLWGKTRLSRSNRGGKVCRPSLRSHSPSEIHRTEQPGRPKRSNQSGDALRQLPPQEEKG